MRGKRYGKSMAKGAEMQANRNNKRASQQIVTTSRRTSISVRHV